MSKYSKLAILILLLVIGAAWICYSAFTGTNDNFKIRKGLDIAGGMRVVLEADKNSPDWPVTDVAAQRSLMEKATSTIEKRIGGISGVSEGKAFTSGNDKIVVEIPGVKDTDQALNTIKNTAQLEFYYLKDIQSASNPGGKWTITPSNDNEYMFSDGTTEIDSTEKEKVMKEVVGAPANHPILTGKDLLPTARQGLTNNTKPIVNIQFNKEGKVVFREFTRKHVGDTLAIFLNGQLLTAPTINETIPNGEAQISGFDNLEEAKGLAEMLNSGALPVSFKDVSREQVEPTIGGDAFKQTTTAGILGLAIVIIFMIAVYRLPGAIAALALCIYTAFVLAIFAIMKVTLSLSGVGALIISIGMAVDANILIFERLKEELRAGKTLHAAIDSGFSRAFTAIFDSNICTCITCLLLIQFGSPSVQSFAVTLLIGTLVSMFTAITVTRTLLHLTVSSESLQKPAFFGVSDAQPKHAFHINFIDNRKWYYMISITASVICLAALLMWGLNLGIEFKPGTEIQVGFKNSVSVSNVKEIVSKTYDKNEVQLSKNSQVAYIKVPNIGTSEQDKLVADLDAKYTVENRTEEGKPIANQASTVAPSVSKELVSNSLKSVLFACIAIILYLAIRFAIGGFLQGVRYGVCAVIALIHDVLFIIGLFAVLGHMFGWQINSLFVTAVLTIIGFSVHDTIVCFDRIRENLNHKLKGESFGQLANRSINQTLTRSIYTSLTVFITVTCLIIFGGAMLREFYVALLVGITVGTYSSIFIATQILVSWHNASLSKKEKESQSVASQGKVLVEVSKPVVETAPVVKTETVVDEQENEDSASKAKKKSSGRKRRF